MIKNICKDNSFLSLPSISATNDDISIGKDLLDTLKANSSICVGMAANMIGINKAIIAIYMQEDNKYIVMYNPIILRKYGKKYKVQEGCLSHVGKKETIRYEKIQLEYQNEDFKRVVKTFTGFTSEIIQHEVDHLFGILI